MEEVLNIGGIDCYEKDGVAYLKLETVARGLGFTEIAKSGNECIKWSRVRKYLADLNFIDTYVDDVELPDFIPENIFYRLAMKAKNETAEKFQAKVADEIIPSIRKYGGYGARISAELEEKLLSYMQKHEEQISRLEQILIPQGDNRQFNPFAPGETAKKNRESNLNRLVSRVSKLCGLKKNRTLHYLYKTLEENLGVSIDSYLEVHGETFGHSWNSTMEVVCRYDNLYQEAVRLCEEVIERKKIFG